MDITLLKQGEKARVVELAGGCNFSKRIESIGIRKGVEIVKVSSQIMKGPVTVKVGNTCVAIGYGMAKKIIVEQLESNGKIIKECE